MMTMAVVEVVVVVSISLQLPSSIYLTIFWSPLPFSSSNAMPHSLLSLPPPFMRLTFPSTLRPYVVLFNPLAKPNKKSPKKTNREDDAKRWLINKTVELILSIR